MIPQLDLKIQYDNLKEEIDTKIHEIIASTEFIQGRYVGEFEDQFLNAHGGKFCIGCANGTAALFLALRVLGIKEDDEVITTTNSFIATAEAICHLGARPVFVDIDPDTHNMNLSLIEARINDKTKAIIPVHIYGNPIDMLEVMKIARKHNLNVVEDCSQAHLASFDNRPVGTFGDIGTFSFYPGKNLGAYGDAGAIITNSEALNKEFRILIDHGRKSKYEHEKVGYNLRMDAIQAGVLTVKLKYLRDWTRMRQNVAKLYSALLNHTSIHTPKVMSGANHVFHQYVIKTEQRDLIM
ncbi:MAG: DegT/DnrJ/EryC1/StrS family aminotransferase, partial [Oligoflexia bacterium]|nr:DegT/DnrJ/EryC1/StrS family aminotransferase [Oligoflexia bacterium]